MKDINERGLYLACGYDKAIETEDFGIQLVLRKFEDMTEAELIEYERLTEINNLKAYLYLLSIGIDLFDAIEQDLAINEKELK